ncbi:PREDICTED: interactor of constitutive active ROPs 2, chloroplastic-like isoform X2 [Populus euphratica]|uniref:Interactor of constitutive active ROPs 2, chloroplastic-like isoform X2 n=1 Tax=Populus euphratica TaxID=75702 RepID=A0AAJ6T4N9_POPEU|nr:PREDICTED: interactor of constitutive active ROPs 2, chloroplastic-like isoform X2 [Populus euphratica]
MQTPKAKTISLEVPRKKSPATPRTRQLKTPGAETDCVSPNPASRTPKDRSPKVTERKSPRSPATERPSNISELESQLAQLQEDLKKAKEQLNTSESWKRRSQQEAEDTKKQLLTMSLKLEESQHQLMELSSSEDVRVQELRKISHDRDKAWESELEAVQKQHSIDYSALASAMNETQRLKTQLEMVVESEASQTKHVESVHAELKGLRLELTETLSLVEKMKIELSDTRESEAQALELASKTQKQLEEANATADMLQAGGVKSMEAYRSLSLELEQSRAQEKSLEELVSKLQADLANVNEKTVENPTGDVQVSHESVENEETKQLKAETNLLKNEVGQLRSLLEATETRYQEEYIQSTLQIRSAYEQVEHTKLESSQREAKLETELKKAKNNIEELRANLMDKETELQGITEENEGLMLKIKKNQTGERESELAMGLKNLEHDLAELKASLLDKEVQLQRVAEENETLRTEIKKGEIEQSKVNDEAVAMAETARASEHEALMKLGYLTEEADKSSRRAARVTEQLDAAQAANTEMEAELRRLKVQADQWRKAAEAAAAMLSTGNNGKFVERTGSLDSNYNPIAGNMGSPGSEDMDDSPRKKNRNMLKKIGVLWKKGQK